MTTDIEKICSAIAEMKKSVDALKEDVNNLNQDQRSCREESSRRSRSRSRSPICKSLSATKSSLKSLHTPRSAGNSGLSWSDRMDAEDAAESLDEEDNTALIDVSEETRELLTISCTRSVPNETPKRTWSKYPLPKVVATKTLAVDFFLRSDISQATKFLDSNFI